MLEYERVRKLKFKGYRYRLSFVGFDSVLGIDKQCI